MNYSLSNNQQGELTMTTKAKHRWRSHKTNGRIIFKSKDKAHKERYWEEKFLNNVLDRSEKEVKED